MHIIIPMAGAGQRFTDAGYDMIKPAIPTIDWRTGKELPMAICATKDLQFAEESGNNMTFIIRNTVEKDFLEKMIRESYPRAHFVYVEKLTEGQACTCLLAKSIINNGSELLIGTCDNGMLFEKQKFIAEAGMCDVISFTYRHDEAVLLNPNAYGWLKVDDNNFVVETSIKNPISDNPMEDHAITGAFWFKRGRDFVAATEAMISRDDRINGEFYVDLTLQYLLNAGLSVKVFEIDRYLGWGTPQDYERYQNTYRYWESFVENEQWL